MSDTVLTANYIQSALQTLVSTNDSLAQTQKETSSGYKIASPSDNASYWSVANSMTSDNKVLSSVNDALGMGASKVDTASNAVTSAIDLVNDIISDLTTAKEDGTDKTSLNDSINELKGNLTSLVTSASFGNDNWLYNTSENDPGTKQVPAFFQRSVSGAVSLSYMNFDADSSTLIDTADPSRGLFTQGIDSSTLSSDNADGGTYSLLDSGDADTIGLTDDTTSDQIDDMISVMSYINDNLTKLGATLGTMTDRIDTQTDFISSLSTVMDDSVSDLVDANMEEESTKLSAYQSQQQLASQILGMANTHLQSLAVLFQ